MGISSSGATVGGPTSSISSQSMSAGPASGKYGGYSNKDFEQMGYNNPSYGNSNGYDPYVNSSKNTPANATSTTTAKKDEKHSATDKPKKKKKKAESSDEDSSASSESSSEEEKSDDEKKKKKKSTGLGAPKQADRSISGNPVAKEVAKQAPTPSVQPSTVSAPSQNLLDLMEESQPKPAVATQSQPNNFFDFLGSAPAPAQPQPAQ